MTREDIIKLAREAGWTGPEDNLAYVAILERFAALVAAAKEQEMLGRLRHIIVQAEERGAAAERENSLRLWMLLDDVDTADDIAKSDDAVYRSLCRQAHQKRWAVMTGDEVDAAIRAKGETK